MMGRNRNEARGTEMTKRHPDEREGEVTLPFDPAEAIGGPRVMFIGRLRSPWKTREDCPRNISIARGLMRDAGQTAAIEVDAAFRPGLDSLALFTHIIVIYWMDRAARHIIIQRPRSMRGPRGVFSLRSPVRPNPIALATVKVLDIDQDAGLTIDAIDCMDGTPLIDIKPWMESIDAPEDFCGEKKRGE